MTLINTNRKHKERKMKLKEQNLVTSTLLLTITSLLTRTLGMVSSIYLSKTLGTDGMGIYELVMTIYMTAVIFSSAGLSVTVSRMVAEALGKQSLHLKNSYHHEQAIMRSAFTFAITISVIIATLLFIFAPKLTKLLIHDTSATTGLRFLALSLPATACSSCFKGYFYATKKTAFPASADILEQIVKVLLVIILVRHYAPYGTILAYRAIGIGLTISECVSFTYLFSLYTIHQRKQSRIKQKGFPIIDLLKILLPIACISYLSYLLSSVENTLIPAGLEKYGANYTQSMSLFGILHGMVFPILLFPSAFLTAFSTTLIPEIAKSNALGRKERVLSTTNRVLSLAFILSIFVVGIFMTYGDELGIAIYKNEEVGPILKVLAIIVPFLYSEVITDSILKGLDKQVSCLKFSMIDSVMRIVFIYFLLPIKGIRALLGITIISCVFTSVLNLGKLLETTGIRFKLINWIIKPTIAAAFSSNYSHLLIARFLPFTLSPIMHILLGVGIMILLYIPILFLIQTLGSEDVAWLKRQLRLAIKVFSI